MDNRLWTAARLMRTCRWFSAAMAVVAGCAGLVFSAAVFAVDFNVSSADEFQAALTTAAGNGADDVILLAPGIYDGNFKFVAEDSSGLAIVGAGPEQTFLDGGERAFVIFLSLKDHIADIEISSLTIRASGARGQSIRIDSANTESFFRWTQEFHPLIWLKSAVIAGNMTETPLIEGVGIELVLSDVEILNNQSDHLLSCTDSCAVRIFDSRFEDNLRFEANGVPGIAAGAIEIRNSYFSDVTISSERYNGGPSWLGCSIKDSVFRISGINCQHQRFDFHGNVYDKPASSIRLMGVGNVVGNKIFDSGVLVVVDPRGEEISISGNLMARSFSSGVAMSLSVVDYSRLELLSNTFSSIQSISLSPSTSGASHVVANNVVHTARTDGLFPIDQLVFPESSQLINNILPSGEIGYWDQVENNVQADPLFFDIEGNDFHVSADSPAINAGLNSAVTDPEATDLDGNPRILDGTVDIGAYERSTTALHPADVNGDNSISMDEFNNYNEAWRANDTWPVAPSQIPVDFVTRAGYLLQKGGNYLNIGVGKPATWVPANE